MHQPGAFCADVCTGRVFRKQVRWLGQTSGVTLPESAGSDGSKKVPKARSKASRKRGDSKMDHQVPRGCSQRNRATRPGLSEAADRQVLRHDQGDGTKGGGWATQQGCKQPDIPAVHDNHVLRICRDQVAARSFRGTESRRQSDGGLDPETSPDPVVRGNSHRGDLILPKACKSTRLKFFTLEETLLIIEAAGPFYGLVFLTQCALALRP